MKSRQRFLVALIISKRPRYQRGGPIDTNASCVTGLAAKVFIMQLGGFLKESKFVTIIACQFAEISTNTGNPSRKPQRFQVFRIFRSDLMEQGGSRIQILPSFGEVSVQHRQIGHFGAEES